MKPSDEHINNLVFEFQNVFFDSTDRKHFWLWPYSNGCLVLLINALLGQKSSFSPNLSYMPIDTRVQIDYVQKVFTSLWQPLSVLLKKQGKVSLLLPATYYCQAVFFFFSSSHVRHGANWVYPNCQCQPRGSHHKMCGHRRQTPAYQLETQRHRYCYFQQSSSVQCKLFCHALMCLMIIGSFLFSQDLNLWDKIQDMSCVFQDKQKISYLIFPPLSLWTIGDGNWEDHYLNQRSVKKGFLFTYQIDKLNSGPLADRNVFDLNSVN